MSSSLRSYVNDFVRQKKFKGFSGQMISDTQRSGTRFFEVHQVQANLRNISVLAPTRTTQITPTASPGNCRAKAFQARNQ
jgi:hypothetical protein